MRSAPLLPKVSQAEVITGRGYKALVFQGDASAIYVEFNPWLFLDIIITCL